VAKRIRPKDWSVYYTPEGDELVRRAAKLQGRSVSDFVLRAAVAAAKLVVETAGKE